MIHTFGDSHARIGWPVCENLKLHEIGPILAHSFGIDKLKRLDISKFNVKDEDVVVFSFGEIDCRCHIHKYITKKTVEEIINEIIYNYINAIKENVSQYKNLKVYILSVPPASRKKQVVDNEKFPHLGEDEERKKYVKIFNEVLIKYCKKYSYLFLDHYTPHLDSEGHLSEVHSFDGVHVTDNRFFKMFISNIEPNYNVKELDAID